METITHTRPRLIAATRVVTLHDFGALDERGRAIGCRIIKCETEFYACESGGWRNKPPGIYFSYNGQNTRNGGIYGASQPDRHFATAAERDAAAARYLLDAQKRYVPQVKKRRLTPR